MYDSDLPAIERYNARVSGEYRLHPEMGPSPHEGNIDTAPVVRLLANPYVPREPQPHLDPARQPSVFPPHISGALRRN